MFSMISDFEFWLFLAGLGLFLYGMHRMEDSIKLLSGSAFKGIIRRYTYTRPKAILSGMVSTAVLQSSSAVSLMVLAFVGAGIMNLVQAIAVMMGAKIGTTSTAWIVAVFGFSFDIESFTLPMIALGGLGMILLDKWPKYAAFSRFLISFGFLFMGLDFMKSSVDQFSQVIDPSALAGYGVVVFAVAGLIMTAIMQSSSATIAIVLTMLFSGVIGFQSGAAMVIGANVGTTVTVILGAIGGVTAKKQAAVSQLIFTTGTAIIMLLILPFLAWLVLTVFNFEDRLVLGLALFHSLFNVMGVAIFYPFIPQLARKTEKWIPEKVVHLSRYIQNTEPEVSEAGIEAFRKEISRQLVLSLEYVQSQIEYESRTGSVAYPDLKMYNAEIFEYYTRLHAFGKEEGESVELDKFLRSSRNIMNATRNIHEYSMELMRLRNEKSGVLAKAFTSFSGRLGAVTETGKDFEDLNGVSDLLRENVEKLFLYVQEEDKKFIKFCGDAILDKSIEKEEVTFLLMFNRTVTHSCRMFIYAMQSLLQEIDTSEKTD